MNDNTMLMPCAICNQTDIILKENAKDWKCPFCHFAKMQQNNVIQDMRRIEQMYAKLNELNNKCTDNMNRLNAMMLEMKGLVAKIRPEVKKTGWYGDELKADAVIAIEIGHPELEH